MLIFEKLWRGSYIYVLAVISTDPKFKQSKNYMPKFFKFLSALFVVTIFSCNQNSTTEKENELLKKENELLKKEQELNSKYKTQEPAKPTANNTSNRADTWKKFNHKYGFTIELPSYFSKGALTASGIQYYINDLNDNITVTVETIGEGSISSLTNEYQSTINSSSGVDYKILKENWFVVSGQDEEGIYYLKTLVKNGQTHFLAVRYPVSQKDIFDSILPRISKSFK
jgi:hypothetical protein